MADPRPTQIGIPLSRKVPEIYSVGICCVEFSWWTTLLSLVAAERIEALYPLYKPDGGGIEITGERFLPHGHPASTLLS
jgi:hypothetical protein